MRNMLIPSLLGGIIIIAGIFAFMPIDKATSVHTLIFAESNKLSVATAQQLTAGSDFTITCPAGSEGCYLLDGFLIEEDAGAEDVDIDSIDITIDGQEFNLAGDTANSSVDDSGSAISGVSGIPMTAGDTISIDIGDDSDSDDYTLVLVAQVEGNEDIDVDADA